MRARLPFAVLCVLWCGTLGAVSTSLLAAQVVAYAGPTQYDFPENFGVRVALHDTIVAPTSDALAAPTQILTDPSDGMRVKFSVTRQLGDFYLLFTNENGGHFPLAGRGTYIIRRSMSDGSFNQVKIFLGQSSDSFVRIFPMGGRSRLDLVLFGFPMYEGVNLPIDFQTVLTSPFSQIISATRNVVNWSLVFPARPVTEDSVVQSMVQVIRARLPKLSDHDDGAMNSNGNFVYIRTLQALSHGGFNCSGFDKWIIDGLYAPRTGHLISIEELKKKHLQLRANPESWRWEDLDPYFGLDWTRNLALAVNRLTNPSAGPEDSDVTDVPFFRFVPDVGYPLDDLRFILYALAVDDPGYFYLGSVNHELPDHPGIRQHSHVVALFPYFAADGSFTVAVMERNLETGIESLQRRYPQNSIVLERIAASRNFDPPKID